MLQKYLTQLTNKNMKDQDRNAIIFFTIILITIIIVHLLTPNFYK